MMHNDIGWMGFGYGHGLFGLVFWVLIILVVAALLKYLFGKK